MIGEPMQSVRDHIADFIEKRKKRKESTVNVNIKTLPSLRRIDDQACHEIFLVFEIEIVQSCCLSDMHRD